MRLINCRLQMRAFIIIQVKGGLKKGKRQLTSETLASLSTGGHASNSKINSKHGGVLRLQGSNVNTGNNVTRLADEAELTIYAE